MTVCRATSHGTLAVAAFAARGELRADAREARTALSGMGEQGAVSRARRRSGLPRAGQAEMGRQHDQRPQDIQAAVTGDVDFGGAFNWLDRQAGRGACAREGGASPYMGADKQTNGGLFVLQDSPIRSARDLVGRKVGVNTPGAYEQYLVTAYLGEVRAVQRRHPEGDVRRGAAGQPCATAQAEAAGRLFLRGHHQGQAARRRRRDAALRPTDQLFGLFGYASYIFTDRFIAQNPNTVRKFVDGTARAIEWAKKTPREEVVARLKKIVETRTATKTRPSSTTGNRPGVGGKGGVISRQRFHRPILTGT